MLARARSFLLDLLEMEERCFSKLSFQSIIIKFFQLLFQLHLRRNL